MTFNIPPSKRRKRKIFAKIARVTSIASVFTLTLVGLGMYFFSNLSGQIAKADSNNSITLKPGQTGRFFIRYGNASTDTNLENVILNIRLGKSLELKPETLVQLNTDQTKNLTPNQIKQQFNNIEKYPINTNFQSGSESILSSSTTFSSIIKYAPGSANNTSTPSGNLSGVTLATESFGYVVFEAKLKNNVFTLNNPKTGANYKVGDELSPLDQEGVLSFLDSSNTNRDSVGRYSVIIGQPDAISIKPENLNQGFCNPEKPLLNATINYCAFPLVDDAGNPITDKNQATIPNGLNISADGASGNSNTCRLVNSSEINRTGNQIFLYCVDIPLQGAKEGETEIKVNFPSGQNKKLATVDIVKTSQPKEISVENINQAACSTNSQLIGQNLGFCAFQLLQNGALVTDPNLIQIPNNLTASIGTATGTSNQCQIVAYNQINQALNLPASTTNHYWLKCDNTPTTGAEIGVQEIILNLPNNVKTKNAGFVNLYNQGTKKGCQDIENQCRLYFVGANKGTINWNPALRFNVDMANGGGWPRNQIFKQGDSTVVFDEIKNSDNTLIADGSECTFQFYRYTQTAVLRTKTSTTQGGKCQVELPKTEQSVNYYRVIATAVDKQKNETMRAVDTLIFPVGSAPAPKATNIGL